MAAVQIIFNDLPDGRVEVSVIQRIPDPSIASAALAVSRVALVGLADVMDVRTLMEGLALGRNRITDKMLAWDVGGEADLASPSPDAILILTERQRAEA